MPKCIRERRFMTISTKSGWTRRDSAWDSIDTVAEWVKGMYYKDDFDEGELKIIEYVEVNRVDAFEPRIKEYNCEHEDEEE